MMTMPSIHQPNLPHMYQLNSPTSHDIHHQPLRQPHQNTKHKSFLNQRPLNSRKPPNKGSKETKLSKSECYYPVEKRLPVRFRCSACSVSVV